MSKLTDFVKGFLSGKGVDTSNMSEAELADAAKNHFEQSKSFEDRLSALESVTPKSYDDEFKDLEGKLDAANGKIAELEAVLAKTTGSIEDVSKSVKTVEEAIADVKGNEKPPRVGDSSSDTMYTLEQATAELAKIEAELEAKNTITIDEKDLEIGV